MTTTRWAVAAGVPVVALVVCSPYGPPGPILGGPPIIPDTCAGEGGTCTFPTTGTIAAKLSLDLDPLWSWSSTNVAAAYCNPPGCPDAAMPAVSIVLQLDYTLDPSTHKFTGTLKTCKNQTQPATLTDTAAGLLGVPKGTLVQIVIPNTTWDSDRQARANISGTIGSADGTFRLDPLVALNGIAQTSMLRDQNVMWPPHAPLYFSTPTIPFGDLSNDDGNPFDAGITGAARGDMRFFVPRAALMMTGPQPDSLYLAMRTQFTLSGCMTNCTEAAGNASVALLDSHIIGCHIQTDADAGRFCTPAEYNMVDQYQPAYSGASGTFVTKIVTTGTGDGGVVTCDDVRAAFL